MTLTHNSQVVDDAVSRLITQFKEKENFEKTIRVLTSDHQKYEDSLWYLFEGSALSNSVGAQLDLVGDLLGILRLGRTDSIFRTRLQAVVIQYTSSGRWEQLIEGFRLLTGARSTQGGEIFPAAVELTAIGATNLTTIDLIEIAEALRKLKAVGVRLQAALIVADPPFVFGGDPDISGRGFADENNMLNTGGYFPLALTI